MAPAAALVLLVPNLVFAELSALLKATYVVIWAVGSVSVYFNLKHAIVPDLDFGFVRALKPYNVLSLAVGFAVWLPFGFTGSKTLPFLMNGGLSLILHSGLGIIGRLLTYETYAMNLKKEFTENYDWYLYNLSIKKEAQGKGIASKLMRPMLQFCDDERMVSYLETNKEANVGLYRHYGFDLMKEEQIPKSTVTHDAMARKPMHNEKYEKGLCSNAQTGG